MEKHRALSQEHYSKMDALEEAYQVNITSVVFTVKLVLNKLTSQQLRNKNKHTVDP